jgi:hypothetical protein
LQLSLFFSSDYLNRIIYYTKKQRCSATDWRKYRTKIWQTKIERKRFSDFEYQFSC